MLQWSSAAQYQLQCQTLSALVIQLSSSWVYIRTHLGQHPIGRSTYQLLWVPGSTVYQSLDLGHTWKLVFCFDCFPATHHSPLLGWLNSSEILLPLCTLKLRLSLQNLLTWAGTDLDQKQKSVNLITPSVFEFTGPAVILLVISDDEISPLPLEYSQHFFPETPKPGQPSFPPETVELVAMEAFVSSS